MGLLSKRAYSVSTLLVMIPIALSAYTHLWNPAGFPNLFYDEGVYMRRAMHVMEGLGPQEAYYYDHPFFGQIFLASMLTIVGYPESLHPSASLPSMESLYLVPRTLMGILAVIDTLLLYKISERIYNRNVALFGSILFAVLPSTWFTRMILLDSLLLPLLLLSILLALYSTTTNSKNKTKKILILLSGILLGLAIFTKIPAFTMIPLVAFLIYRPSRSLKSLATWFVPVLLIPLIWPVQSIVVGSFDSWTNDVLWQINRDNARTTLDHIPISHNRSSSFCGRICWACSLFHKKRLCNSSMDHPIYRVHRSYGIRKLLLLDSHIACTLHGCG